MKEESCSASSSSPPSSSPHAKSQPPLEKKKKQRPRLHTVNLALTARCNIRCPCCYQPAFRGDLPYDLLCQWLDQLGAMRDNTLVMLSGGEPLLYHGHLDLIRRCVSWGMRVLLGTNGVAINYTVAMQLAASGLAAACIGLDLPLPQESYRPAKDPEALEKTVQVFSLLGHYGIPTVANVIVTPDHVDHLFEIAQFVQEIGAQGLNFIRPKPIV